jgi:hypothetical protein
MPGARATSSTPKGGDPNAAALHHLRPSREAPPRIDTPVLIPAARGGYIDIERLRQREWTPALRAAGLEHRRICDRRTRSRRGRLRTGSLSGTSRRSCAPKSSRSRIPTHAGSSAPTTRSEPHSTPTTRRRRPASRGEDAWPAARRAQSQTPVRQRAPTRCWYSCKCGKRRNKLAWPEQNQRPC